jgi:ribosomal-protein-alanine N-acetyltransferase
MSLFPAEMESERLRYERLHPEEFDPLELYQYVHRDAPHIDEITRHVTWDPYDHPKEAVDWVQQCGDAFEKGESATYVLRPTEGERTGEFAGLASLGPDWGRRSAELGTWLRKPFWGRGYSGERAARMLELAFDRLDLDLVTVSHDPDNDPSRRAIERYVDRFGGRKVGLVRNDILIDSQPRDSIRYSISREEWERNAISPDGGEHSVDDGGEKSVSDGDHSTDSRDDSCGSFFPDAI